VSDRTRNFLWLYGLTIAITIGAVAAGCLIFFLFNGTINMPAATVNNFWSLTNTILIPALFGWIAFKLDQHKRQSQRNEQKIDSALEKVDQIDQTIKNGGGQGTKEIRQIVDGIAAKLDQPSLGVTQPLRDPSSRDRSTDQEA
jgi:hypothetical protein